MKPWIIAPVAALLLLGACMPSQYLGIADTADAAAEVEVDASIAFFQKRLCNMPIDWIRRQREDQGPNWFKGWRLMCPQNDVLFTGL